MTPAVSLTVSAEMMRVFSAVIGQQMRLNYAIFDQSYRTQRALMSPFISMPTAKSAAKPKPKAVVAKKKSAKKKAIVAKAAVKELVPAKSVALVEMELAPPPAKIEKAAPVNVAAKTTTAPTPQIVSQAVPAPEKVTPSKVGVTTAAASVSELPATAKASAPVAKKSAPKPTAKKAMPKPKVAKKVAASVPSDKPTSTPASKPETIAKAGPRAKTVTVPEVPWDGTKPAAKT